MKKIIYLSALLSSTAHSLFLENLVESEILEETLAGKTIGVYVGSFDPLHRGHESVATSVVEQGLCDYVLIYPAWGGDGYKNRVDIDLRLNMAAATFGDHPWVIVTRLNPQEMQQTLTTMNPLLKKGEKNYVQPKFQEVRFIGILGSDVPQHLQDNKKAESAFMTGMEVTDKYAHQTIGGIMALPVHEFIVFQREGGSIQERDKIGDRPIVKVISASSPYGDASSTKVKEHLKAGTSISDLVNPNVEKIIRENGLY